MPRKLLFPKEVRQLMYGYGDAHSIPESVSVLDQLLEWYIVDLCSKSTRVCRGPRVKAADILNALQKDQKKFARAHELIALDKEIKQAKAAFNVQELGEAYKEKDFGSYDDQYCDYVIAILFKAKQYGFRVFIDPHQDVWSRFTGGSGAPGWTLKYAGLDPKRFAAANAALVHNTYPEPSQFPKMIWATNYYKLAAATMFTLFFGGDVFAPKCRVDLPNTNAKSVSIQTFLQGHYIEAIKYLAGKIQRARGLQDCVVVGYDTLNEPSPGWIGWPDINEFSKEQELKKGLTPTPLQAMILGSGQSVEDVQVWEVGSYGPQKIGMTSVDPNGVSCWSYPSPFFPNEHLGCIWANHGVWDPQTQEALIPNYFEIHPITKQPLEFLVDFWKPFVKQFSDSIRSIHSNAIIFVEAPVMAIIPSFVDDNEPQPPYCYAPHWYDGLTLVSKHFNTWYNVDYLSYLRGRYASIAFAIKFGETGIKQAFKNQLKILRLEGEAALGPCPTIIGEIGIPFDMDDKAAYLTGDYSSQERAMDANMTALEQNLLNFTLWNYCPDNSNVWGDNWNGEDLSIWTCPGVDLATHDSARESTAYPSTKSDDPPVDSLLPDSLISPTTSEGPSFNELKKEGGEILSLKESKPSILRHDSNLKPTSAIQFHRGNNLNVGARTLDAFVRPFPILTPGTPISLQFDLKRKMFSFTFEHPIRDEGESSVWDLDACGISDPHVEFFLPVLHFPKARNTLVWVSDGHVGLYLDVQRCVWRCSCSTVAKKSAELQPEVERIAVEHEIVMSSKEDVFEGLVEEGLAELSLDDKESIGVHTLDRPLPTNPMTHERQHSFPEIRMGKEGVAVVPILSETIQSSGSVARHTIVIRYVGSGSSTYSESATSSFGGRIPMDPKTRSKFDDGWITPIDSRRVRGSDEDDPTPLCPQCSLM